MPNQSDYHNGVMINPYYMSDTEKEIYYAGYKAGRRAFAHEQSWRKRYPDKEFEESRKPEYIKLLGDSTIQLNKEYSPRSQLGFKRKVRAPEDV